MVLDVRYLHGGDSVDAALVLGAEPVAEPGLSCAGSLEALLEAAACAPEPRDQVRATEQLRLLIPSDAGTELLWRIVRTPGDPRRLLAAQVLGYHRQWLASRSRLRQAVEAARQEADAAVAGALVWGLRQRTEAAEFLLSPVRTVAREAALGLPVNRQTLPYLLRAFLHAPSTGPEVDRILQAKLRLMHSSLVQDVVDLLLQEECEPPHSRLVALFAALPQLSLFEIFVEGQQRSEWNPKAADQAGRARLRQQLGRAARAALEEAPSLELVRHLTTRSGEDEAFCRRHGRLLQGLLQRADPQLGCDLIAHLERLTYRASEEKVGRLAHLLIELCERLEGRAASQAAVLLESWKGLSPDLRLRIYQLQRHTEG
ncbi:MAG: hypothetical protein AB1505_28030 [Candidatus Latescibacterota bacterium]